MAWPGQKGWPRGPAGTSGRRTCGACVSTRPVEAIFAEEDVPAQWKDFTAKNKELTAKGPVS